VPASTQRIGRLNLREGFGCIAHGWTVLIPLAPGVYHCAGCAQGIPAHPPHPRAEST
jgi:hypothetical protein